MAEAGLGLVLSGGGTRCVAHLAVAQCLQEWSLAPAAYAGASGGALVAVLLASGKPAEEVLALVHSLRMRSLLKPQLNRRGLLNIEAALKGLTAGLPQTFEELEVPVSISVTNLRTGRGELFSSGPLLPPLLASCCMPVFFCPVQIGENLYADAGLVNNMPADALWGRYRYLLGVHTNPIDPQFTVGSARSILERSFLLAINNNVFPQKRLCHRVLEPALLAGYKVFDFRRMQEIYEKTYQWLQPQMAALAAEIQQKRG
jgi:NTE family protein